MNPRLASIIVATIWGSTYIVTTSTLPDEPVFIAAARALGGALPLLLLTRTLPAREWLGRIVVLGTLNFGLFFGLLFVAIVRLPGGVAATLQALGPLLTVLLAWPVLHQRPTLRRIASVFAGAVGVAMLVLNGEARADAIGVTAGLFAGASLALGVVLLNRWGRPTDSSGRPAHLLALTAWQLVVGGVELAAAAMIVGDVPTTLDAASAAGIAFVSLLATSLAYSLWFYSVEQAGAAAVAPYLLLVPIVAFALDALIERLFPTALQAAGAGLVIGSLLYSQRAGRTR